MAISNRLNFLRLRNQLDDRINWLKYKDFKKY